MRSMTGYGKGEVIRHNRKFSIEIKSVNHRYNDITIKLPRMFNSSEDQIRKELMKKILRGKTDVYINFESYSKDDIKVVINEALAESYIESLTKLKENFNLSGDITISLVSKFPDIVIVEKDVENEQASEAISTMLFEALHIALENFVLMRESEGNNLRIDILQKTSLISDLVSKIKTRSPFVVAEYSERLKIRLDNYLSGINVDENRFLTEITLFADRSCIDEELTRLSSHLVQLEEILTEEESLGRKLDFLVQEMNREANTIGSKSNDMEITKNVIALKSEIEKIREQIQNIE